MLLEEGDLVVILCQILVESHREAGGEGYYNRGLLMMGGYMVGRGNMIYWIGGCRGNYGILW